MKTPAWFESVVRFFDDRERMHQEITDLLAEKGKVEAELHACRARLDLCREYADRWRESAKNANEEANALRKLVSDEAEARKLAGAVTVLKDFIGRTAK